MRRTRIITALFVLLLLAIPASSLFLATPASAADNFSLQVTPSPLVTTVKPGESKVLDLKIRNAALGSEELKIEPRSFSFDNNSGKVTLRDTTPPDIAQWISFSNPTFTVKAGEWYTQKIRINLPKESGFSYSFALVISRKNNPEPTKGGRLIKGSVAVFTLVNVDRPGATRSLAVPKFVTSKGFYEYLPTTLSVQFKNTGNTIVQPYGNIFIQRGSNDKNPISTLPVNETRGYILPGSVRTLDATWDAGFPVYKTSTTSDGSEQRSLVWNWDHASRFRIGRYTAKLVAVYNDGARDVPIQSEVTFWVIPWKSISLLLVVLVALWYVGRWRNKRRTAKAVKRALAAKKEDSHEN